MSGKAEDLVPVFMPALVVLLTHHEQRKGAPLTKDEVLAIRDKATCVMAPADILPAMAESRGYEDIDPERCWEQWLLLSE